MVRYAFQVHVLDLNQMQSALAGLIVAGIVAFVEAGATADSGRHACLFPNAGNVRREWTKALLR
jgi:hypothetical protein